MESHVDISGLSTMRIGGPAKSVFRIKSSGDILKLDENVACRNEPYIIVGAGSNMVFGDNLLGTVAAKMEIGGVEILSDDNEFAVISAAGGEIWDDFVEFAVSRNLSGIEALSAIPGTVGASPVQNIGAYGKEVKDAVLRVEVYDFNKRSFAVMENKDCAFSYRDSIFKRNPGRWLVTKVIFKLNKKAMPEIPDYKDVKDYFAEKAGRPGIREIRRAIINIRSGKLPDPKLIPNCGSFFKNPVVDRNKAELLKNTFCDMPAFDLGAGKAKIPAGYLIEKIGLKGKNLGKIKVYDKNALVLTNPNGASFADLAEAVNKIRSAVLDKFDILLEPEVNMV